MQVRDILILLSRFDPNAQVDGPTLSVLRVKPTQHLILVPSEDKAQFLSFAPHYYEDPTH